MQPLSFFLSLSPSHSSNDFVWHFLSLSLSLALNYPVGPFHSLRLSVMHFHFNSVNSLSVSLWALALFRCFFFPFVIPINSVNINGYKCIRFFPCRCHSYIHRFAVDILCMISMPCHTYAYIVSLVMLKEISMKIDLSNNGYIRRLCTQFSLRQICLHTFHKPQNTFQVEFIWVFILYIWDLM